MNFDNNRLAAPGGEQEISAKLYNPTLTERLEQQKQDLQQRLDSINAALEALKAHPEVQMVMDLIQKVR